MDGLVKNEEVSSHCTRVVYRSARAHVRVWQVAQFFVGMPKADYVKTVESGGDPTFFFRERDVSFTIRDGVLIKVADQ